MGMMIFYGVITFFIELLLVVILAPKMARLITSLIFFVIGILLFNISDAILISSIVVCVKILVLYLVLFIEKRLNGK